MSAILRKLRLQPNKASKQLKAKYLPKKWDIN